MQTASAQLKNQSSRRQRMCNEFNSSLLLTHMKRNFPDLRAQNKFHRHHSYNVNFVANNSHKNRYPLTNHWQTNKFDDVLIGTLRIPRTDPINPGAIWNLLATPWLPLATTCHHSLANWNNSAPTNKYRTQTLTHKHLRNVRQLVCEPLWRENQKKSQIKIEWIKSSFSKIS